MTHRPSTEAAAPLLVRPGTLAALGGLVEPIPREDVLRAGQLSKRLLLLLAVEAAALERAPEASSRAGFPRAMHELGELHRTDPERWQAVLLHPFLDAWAADCLRRLRGGPPQPPQLDYLSHVLITARSSSRRVLVPLRLESTNPQRDRYGRPLADRLTIHQRMLWRQALAEAWELLEASGFARLVGSGVNTVVPLRPAPHGGTVSVSARRTFGAIGASLPEGADSARELAVMLVHEAQHVRLWALLDLVSLCIPDTGRRYRVPWRPDPRPVEAVLHGAYAHLGAALLWRTWADNAVDPDLVARSERECRRLGADALVALEVLARGRVLTELGMVFTRAMAQRLGSL